MKHKIKNWEDVKTFDDIIMENERKIISELEIKSKRRCPYLRKEGKYFYYCGFDLQEIRDKKPEPFNQIYQRHLHVIEMQLHCMGSFYTCFVYSGELRR